MSKRTVEKAKKVRETLKAKGIKTVLPDSKGRLYHMECKSKAPNTDRKDVRRSFLGTRIFYTCPKCGKPLEYRRKMHKNLCMRCGQYLNWNGYDQMESVYLRIDSAEEAYYWAKEYGRCNGMTFEIDPDQWRLIPKNYPTLLFFPFPTGKGYGRFVREAAKDGNIVKEFEGGE